MQSKRKGNSYSALKRKTDLECSESGSDPFSAHIELVEEAPQLGSKSSKFGLVQAGICKQQQQHTGGEARNWRRKLSRFMMAQRRKTSTCSTGSQQSQSSDQQAARCGLGSENKRLIKRRRSSSTILRHLLLQPEQLFDLLIRSERRADSPKLKQSMSVDEDDNYEDVGEEEDDYGDDELDSDSIEQLYYERQSDESDCDGALDAHVKAESLRLREMQKLAAEARTYLALAGRQTDKERCR